MTSTRVLFVCLGNICRSPAAEGIFNKLITDQNLKGFSSDSAGTSGYHEGHPADGRMREHGALRGYSFESLSRPFVKEDFERFDLIIPMDQSNDFNIKKLDTDNQFHRKIIPMVQFCRTHSVEEVPDPYYRGDEGFELVLDILEDACTELVEKLKNQEALS